VTQETKIRLKLGGQYYLWVFKVDLVVYPKNPLFWGMYPGV